jgi:hypothetical protein
MYKQIRVVREVDRRVQQRGLEILGDTQPDLAQKIPLVYFFADTGPVLDEAIDSDRIELTCTPTKVQVGPSNTSPHKGVPSEIERRMI